MGDQEGGLRARLVAVGVALVAEEGVQALTLREIARRAGVSHGAPRRHFPTHRELLSAIAREGFARVAAEAATAAADDGRGARERIAAVCGSYIRFAREHRGMYELMLRHDLLESGYLGLRSVSLPLFDLLTTLLIEARTEAEAETGSRPATATGARSGAGSDAGSDAGPGAGAGSGAGSDDGPRTGSDDRPEAGFDDGPESAPRPGAAPPRVTAGALWANLHGIVQLWEWGALKLATGEDDIDALLRAALDAHLGPDQR
ncbi:TetR/AcrR family transcriptional regulator [Streptomyces zhihengii]|uniref:TetR/AcrR family transcriptional regulator n=1 Tax=Streptomyces zhihengii TaxID=1818004 RepID=UPI0033AFAE20